MATLEQAQTQLVDENLKGVFVRLQKNLEAVMKADFMKGDDWPEDVVLTSLEAALLWKMINSLMKGAK